MAVSVFLDCGNENSDLKIINIVQILAVSVGCNFCHLLKKSDENSLTVNDPSWDIFPDS